MRKISKIYINVWAVQQENSQQENSQQTSFKRDTNNIYLKIIINAENK